MRYVEGRYMREVTLTIRDDGDGYALDEMLRMFSWMRICSELGHPSQFTVRYQGDWTANLEFDFEKTPIIYLNAKKDLKERYFKRRSDQPRLFTF